MILKFKCSKQDLENALRKLVSIRSPVIADNHDVEEAARQLMDAIGITRSVNEGSIYIPTGCAVQDDEVTIGLRPGAVLIVFGDPDGLREADKKQMIEDFRRLQDAVLQTEKKDDH